MSALTQANRDDLLAEIRILLPDAEWASVEVHGEPIQFEDTCGCYSEYTTENCSLYFNVEGTIPEDNDAQWRLRNVMESRVERWAENALEWSGCECCHGSLSVMARIFKKSVVEKP